MQRIIHLLISLILLNVINACNNVPEKAWYHLIPEKSSMVIIPDQGLNVQDIVTKEYASYLDDLTSSAIQQVAGIGIQVNTELKLNALALYPATSVESNFIWIAESSNVELESWAKNFYQPFTQNNYDFNGFVVHKLFFNKGEIFAAQVNDYFIFSVSSLLIENALRSYLGMLPSIALDQEPDPSTFILNTSELDTWIEQFSNVNLRPSILNSFDGAKPAFLKFSGDRDSTQSVNLRGTIPLKDGAHSALVDAFAFKNAPITLDRHIASNAASFAILRLPPVAVPVKPKDQIITRLDSLFLNDIDRYQSFANLMEDEFAFEAFPESGLLSNGEFLYMRKIADIYALKRRLNDLAREGYIKLIDETYQISSTVMGELVGSEMNTMRDFYLAFSNDVVVIAKRKGLAESVNADRIRRRVIYYDDTYSDIRDELPSSLSGFVWTTSGDFLEFIRPYLKSDNIVGGLLSRFDIITMTMSKKDNENEVDFALKTYSKEGTNLPYEELWVMPLSNFELSGKPILGDILGSSSDEIIFSTTDGRVMALAIDGTLVMQTATQGEAPVGGPQLYDWYGNDEQIIFLAAGSRIYAWNENGDLLPRFPIDMGETITAPILVQDILRNGVPEIVVATEDRKVHVLDGRGENVRGWPQNTNATVQTQPVFAMLDEAWSIWTYSENTLHSWLRNGNSRPGYPQFLNSRFTHSPLVFENQVLGSAGDGYLYSVGTQPFFNDSVATVISNDSISVRALYVSNSELSSISVEENVLLKDSTKFIREDLLATQSTNGSIFFYNKNGKLRFTQSLGQPASGTFSPQLVNINSDLTMDVLALAEFGRLFAWEILTDKRLFGIPTSGMKYPVITDLNNDGLKELIAQTREGLRCWTINRPK